MMSELLDSLHPVTKLSKSILIYYITLIEVSRIDASANSLVWIYENTLTRQCQAYSMIDHEITDLLL